jgi:hypothetical protein
MLTIQGKFIQTLPTVEGDSQRGHWVRGGFIIEYGDEYPRKAAFSLFGADKTQIVAAIPAGTPVSVGFNPESREYQGKWYTENRAINVTPMYAHAPQPVQPAYPGQQAATFYGQPTMPSGIHPTPVPATPTPAAQLDDKDNDLPF